MMKLQTWLILPDIHCPWHDVKLLKKVCQLAHRIKPYGLVFSGDFLDLYSLSRHNKDSLYKLKDISLSWEYEQGEKLIGEIMSSCKPVQKHFLYGNHEDNFLRYKQDRDNAKTGDAIESPEQALRLEEQGFTVYTNWMDDSVEIGNNLEVIHGSYTCRHVGAKAAEEHEGSVMVGHSHRFNSEVTGKRGGWNIGWLGDKDSPAFRYMPKAKRRKWCNAFALAHVLDDGSFIAQPVQCWGGRFVVDGRVY